MRAPGTWLPWILFICVPSLFQAPSSKRPSPRVALFSSCAPTACTLDAPWRALNWVRSALRRVSMKPSFGIWTSRTPPSRSSRRTLFSSSSATTQPSTSSTSKTTPLLRTSSSPGRSASPPPSAFSSNPSTPPPIATGCVSAMVDTSAQRPPSALLTSRSGTRVLTSPRSLKFALSRPTARSGSSQLVQRSQVTMNRVSRARMWRGWRRS
mmetsp:Transcript_7646/g.18884  ORF Transcript_7646/g.18884 Transcript_7646/m.18884 type:complete len:210 (-) Transcript_7646:272-901(-)